MIFALSPMWIGEIEKTKLLPWQIPWVLGHSSGNYLTKRPYSGINAITTHFAVYAYGYSTPWFLTQKQAIKLGGRVKANAKKFPILFYLERPVFDPFATTVKEMFAIWHTVYNLDDITGIDIEEMPQEFDHDPIKSCENIVAKMPKPPQILHGGFKACYNMDTDCVTLPTKAKFPQIETYYATLFHELSHATGHKKRLNRNTILTFFDRTSYGKEELVAELGAAFLCKHGGIENKTIKASAAYLNSWLKIIKESPTMLIQAAGAAQKSTDFILRKKKKKKPVKKTTTKTKKKVNKKK